VLAIVELDEGPRLTSTIVAADTDALEVGSEVRPVFEHHGDEPTLLRFRPA
jgi:uncharacterized protein